MIIERTFDADAVRSVIGHPDIKPYTYDADGEIPVPMHESIYHLTAKEDFGYDPGMIETKMIGTVSFLQVNPITWNPHVGVLPQFRGSGTEVLKRACEWMFVNTQCRKIVAYPPTSNPKMVRVFEKCGFRREGYSPKSFLWRGEVFDRVLMGKEKP